MRNLCKHLAQCLMHKYSISGGHVCHGRHRFCCGWEVGGDLLEYVVAGGPSLTFNPQLFAPVLSSARDGPLHNNPDNMKVAL